MILLLDSNIGSPNRKQKEQVLEDTIAKIKGTVGTAINEFLNHVKCFASHS